MIFKYFRKWEERLDKEDEEYQLKIEAELKKLSEQVEEITLSSSSLEHRAVLLVCMYDAEDKWGTPERAKVILSGLQKVRKEGSKSE